MYNIQTVMFHILKTKNALQNCLKISTNVTYENITLFCHVDVVTGCSCNINFIDFSQLVATPEYIHN